MKETGRPVSTGSVKVDGTIRACLHVARLERIAEKVEGRDALLLKAAADAMRALSKKNRELGKVVGRHTARNEISRLGSSFPIAEAATGICDLAADAPVVAYLFRNRERVRVTRRETLPRGAKRIGRFDITSDYREVEQRIKAVTG
ncbi:MAG TPA: hypothetical protein VIT62_14460 [Lysobacter sp.]